MPSSATAAANLSTDLAMTELLLLLLPGESDLLNHDLALLKQENENSDAHVYVDVRPVAAVLGESYR